ncbi:MAG: hypothetical protein ACK4M6_04290 [Hyphomonas sp.]
MTWFVSLVMFWIGISFGFVFGAWWASAHARERDMDHRESRDDPPASAN